MANRNNGLAGRFFPKKAGGIGDRKVGRHIHGDGLPGEVEVDRYRALIIQAEGLMRLLQQGRRSLDPDVNIDPEDALTHTRCMKQAGIQVGPQCFSQRIYICLRVKLANLTKGFIQILGLRALHKDQQKKNQREKSIHS